VDPYVNETIALHAIIHRFNPEITALAHTHLPATVTWGTSGAYRRFMTRRAVSWPAVWALWRKNIQARRRVKTEYVPLPRQWRSTRR
jgi:hypothetical protein